MSFLTQTYFFLPTHKIETEPLVLLFILPIGSDRTFKGVEPDRIIERLHVGDRVFDTLNAPNYPVGVVLRILEEESHHALGASTESSEIVVLFDGSDRERKYPFTDFGKTLVPVSKLESYLRIHRLFTVPHDSR